MISEEQNPGAGQSLRRSVSGPDDRAQLSILQPVGGSADIGRSVRHHKLFKVSTGTLKLCAPELVILI